MKEILPIGLASWVIQDGNYSDFKVGEQRSFALEFHVIQAFRTFGSAQAAAPRFKIKADAELAVTGKRAFAGPEWWVLDFGLPAYTMTRGKEQYESESVFQGNIWLEIDHFAYFERLARFDDTPALIFDWRIERIQVQTGPWISLGDGTRARDPGKLGWRDTRKTDAWKDDDGYAEYLLHCKRIGDLPRRTLSR